MKASVYKPPSVGNDLIMSCLGLNLKKAVTSLSSKRCTVCWYLSIVRTICWTISRRPFYIHSWTSQVLTSSWLVIETNCLMLRWLFVLACHRLSRSRREIVNWIECTCRIMTTMASKLWSRPSKATTLWLSLRTVVKLWRQSARQDESVSFESIQQHNMLTFCPVFCIQYTSSTKMCTGYKWIKIAGSNSSRRMNLIGCMNRCQFHSLDAY